MIEIRILIDGDGCPVVDITLRVAKKHGIECIIFCDTAHVFEKEDAQTVICSKGVDSVDFSIVNHMLRGDIVITQDYGLASMCLAKDGAVLNQNGLEYTHYNIDSLLTSRHISQKIRRGGGRTKGPSKRTADADRVFEGALENLIIKSVEI